MNNKLIPNSNNWWIDGQHAYFSAILVNALFDVDLNRKKCRLVSILPKSKFKSYKLFPNCRKYKNRIFCFPGLANHMLVYDIKDNVWSEIPLVHKGELWMCTDYHKHYDRVWLSEYEGRKIYEVNLEKQIVEKEYQITSNVMAISGECILVQGKIYCVCKNQISCIDMENCFTEVYDLQGLNETLFTICYDGEKFWLSGNCREVYIWSPEKGVIKVISELFERIREYSFQYPLFRNTVSIDNYVWHIPFQLENIIYIDKATYQVYMLKMEKEEEDEKERARRPSPMIKYLVEYVRENRYIGIYSFQHRMIVEVDTMKLCAEYREDLLDERTVRQLADMYFFDKKILWEGDRADRDVFAILLNGDCKEEKRSCQDIGKRIHQNMKNSEEDLNENRF